MEIPLHAASTPTQKASNPKTLEWWLKRHKKQVSQKEKMLDAQIIFIGASVMDYWAVDVVGKGKKRYQRGGKIWREFYLPRKALNFGIAGDNTATTLWRLQNGALDGIAPKVAIVAIGYNNKEKQNEVAEGITAVVREVRRRCPKTKVLLMPYLASTKAGWRENKSFRAYDDACKMVAKDNMIIPLEINNMLVNENGVLKDQALIPDNLHPAEGGYYIWHNAMKETILTLLEEKTDE